MQSTSHRIYLIWVWCCSCGGNICVNFYRLSLNNFCITQWYLNFICFYYGSLLATIENLTEVFIVRLGFRFEYNTKSILKNNNKSILPIKHWKFQISDFFIEEGSIFISKQKFGSRWFGEQDVTNSQGHYKITYQC